MSVALDPAPLLKRAAGRPQDLKDLRQLGEE
jgi:hypothetical protein